MTEIWNQLKTIVFQRSLFKVPFWLWIGPVFLMLLSAVLAKLQPQIFFLFTFFSLIGVFLSGEYKEKGVVISSILMSLLSIVFHRQMVEPIATQWLYVFGAATAFLTHSYCVEEYESWIFHQAEESKKNSEDVKLWQNRFEANQLRLEREKERFEQQGIEFEKQEDRYLEKIDQLEKMFHSTTFDLRQEQNRGVNLHQELKKLLIDRYELQNQIKDFEAKQQEMQQQIKEIKQQDPLPTQLSLESIPLNEIVVQVGQIENPEQNGEEENIYFSSF